MKKIFITLCIAFIGLNSFAQSNEVYFEWQPSGRMLSKDGTDFQIIQLEGKPKETIYNEFSRTFPGIVKSGFVNESDMLLEIVDAVLYAQSILKPH